VPYGLFTMFIGLSFLNMLSLERFAYTCLLDEHLTLNDLLVGALWMLAMPAAFLFLLRPTGMTRPQGHA
jgi:hypothetical protein